MKTFKSITHNSGLTAIVINVTESNNETITFFKTITKAYTRKETVTNEVLSVTDFNNLISCFSGIEMVKLAQKVKVVVSGGDVCIGIDFDTKEAIKAYKEGHTHEVLAISLTDAHRISNQICHSQGREVIVYSESGKVLKDSDFN